MLILLLAVLIKSTGYYLSPLSAHLQQERSSHYGPSEVKYTENYDKGKYYLCSYDRWISCDTVKRKYFFLWKFGERTIFEYDKSKIVDYSWFASSKNSIVYGIVNDNKVKKIEVIRKDGKIFTQTKFYDNLFLFHWTSRNVGDIYYVRIKAYDSKNKLIYQKDINEK